MNCFIAPPKFSTAELDGRKGTFVKRELYHKLCRIASAPMIAAAREKTDWLPANSDQNNRALR
ncbi:MAG: hypothetical protein WAN75_50470, partial [Xanthobacteraceae bacterium]